MRPSRLLLKYVSALLACAAGLWMLRLFPQPGPAWLSPENMRLLLALAGSCLCLAAVTDFIVARRHVEVVVNRNLLGAFSQGSHNEYTLSATNKAPWKLRVGIREGLPVSFANTQSAIQVDVDPGDTFTQKIVVIPSRRGDFTINPAWVMADSKWGLWTRRLRRGGSSGIQVYPNFSMLRSGPEFGLEEQIHRMGLHRVQRRGRGMDFHQLREFVVGDSPVQVDWKASSRFNKLIAREYQDDRDQRIFFLLDGGHRMRAMNEGFSLFDHAVNALLVTAFVALKQGDSVGFVSFAGQQKWVQPAKGRNGMQRLLNQAYNLQSTTETSDYLQMAGEFMRKQPRRSLVILITSIHADDLTDLKTTVQLLRRSHLVMIVAITEPFIGQMAGMAIDDQQSARRYAGMVEFQFARTRLLARLRSEGVVAMETTVAALSATITREYLQMKRAGRL